MTLDKHSERDCSHKNKILRHACFSWCTHSDRSIAIDTTSRVATATDSYLAARCIHLAHHHVPVRPCESSLLFLPVVDVYP
jgi:hypothetical protein